MCAILLQTVCLTLGAAIVRSSAIPLQMLESVASSQDSVLVFWQVTHRHLRLKINSLPSELTEFFFCPRHNTADFGRHALFWPLQFLYLGLTLFFYQPLTFKNRASYIQDGRTATPQMLHFIYFFSTNVSTEYFKHAAHSPFFSSKCRLLHNATFFSSCIIHILHTGCAKI